MPDVLGAVSYTHLDVYKRQDQDAQLFAGTIRENVAFARPDASDADVDDAVRRAQLDEWVAGLPSGLDTPIGERGALLSGGQRQRVALALSLIHI